ncbi:peptidase C39 family protein [Candidatus Woesearchaeota archaeon]|nr:peptidase C39 family protein [Candidatus Woesearchaeota archaeon]
MQPYLQTTPFTTAAASLLNILHRLDSKIPLNRETEFMIWKETVTLPTRGSSIYALALYAHQQGFHPTVIVERKEYHFPDYRFYRYTKEEIELAAFSEELHRQTAEKAGIPLLVKDLHFSEIIQLVKQQKTLLLRLNCKPLRDTKRNSSHFLAIVGFKDEKYSVIDPSQGLLHITEDLLQEAFTSIESKKHRDHRIIIF